MNWFGRIKDLVISKPRRADQANFTLAFASFQKILETNNQILELMADMGDKQGGQFVFDRQYIISSCEKAKELSQHIIMELNKLAPKKFLGLYEAFQAIEDQIDADLSGQMIIPKTPYVISNNEFTRESAEVVGNKNAHLAAVHQVLGLPTPPCFMITTKAYHDLMAHDGLRERMQPWLEQWKAGEIDSEKAAEALRPIISNAELPHSLERALRKNAHHLLNQAGGGAASLAVRSSATGEDGALSFAGQYRTELGVTAEDLPKAYISVVASVFRARALEYRRQWGISEDQVAMAVGCQLMVPAQAAGVLYTLDPLAPEQEYMLISAAFGLGGPVVSGQAPADHLRVSRGAPYNVLSLNAVPKPSKLVPVPGGGIATVPVGPESESSLAINSNQAAVLAEMAIRIENYFKAPQDIEWALDQDGNPVILQVRSLNLKPQVSNMICDIADVLDKQPVLLSRRGAVAQQGIGAGPVYVVHNDKDLDDFPEGAILVTRFTSPRLGKVMSRARGVITDLGSPTGHLATIAREFRVPTIVGAGIATKVLQTGMEITMDAGQNVVYAGKIKELCYFQFAEDAFEETPEYRLLCRVLRRIAPLNLVDPKGANFTPKGCLTLHDITRFAHEKAVEELLSIEYHHSHGAPSKRLDTGLPLGLLVIDIGGGLDAAPGSTDMGLDELCSKPALAFLEGMAEPGLWATDPMPVDFGGFMSSVTRTFASYMTSPQAVGQNLAVVSRDYLNLNMRLGYHFNIVDAYVSEDSNANYAYFRFHGGVTDMLRRARRARFLSEVLSHHDFMVDVRGDLVVARIKKLPEEVMLEKVRLLGRLVSFSRQLDIKMQNDEAIDQYLQNFLSMNDSRTMVPMA